MSTEGFAYQTEKEITAYDRGVVVRAEGEVKSEVENRCEQMEGGATLENKIIVLRALLAEYGEVKPGTNIAADNGKWPYAEAAAEMRFKLESERDFLEKIGRPANDNAPAVVQVAA